MYNRQTCVRMRRQTIVNESEHCLEKKIFEPKRGAVSNVGKKN